MGVYPFLWIILSLSDVVLAVYREHGFVNDKRYVAFLTKHVFSVHFVGAGAASACVFLRGR